MKQQKIEVGDFVAYVWMRRIECGTVDEVGVDCVRINTHLVNSKEVYLAEETVDGKIIIDLKTN